MYYRFSAGFGNVDQLDSVNFSPADIPMFCAVIAWIVQFFYAFRVYMLRRPFLWISLIIASVWCLAFVSPSTFTGFYRRRLSNLPRVSSLATW